MTAAQRARAVAAPEPEGYCKYLFLSDIFIIAALVLLCMLMTAAAHAQAPVARVLETKGTTLVERSGQMPRLLGAGETLSERDTVNVARDSWALIEFNDQTRVTLRPNTVFRLDSYKADAPETMLLGLVKGGLRVVTGLFGKRNPQGVKFQTAVATIGIRGTEFDARLCEADCAAEEKSKPAPRQLVLPVARVVEMNGVVAAGRAGETVRLLVPGAGLIAGEQIDTARGASALLAFRDGSKLALGERSRVRIESFNYDAQSINSGSAVLRLLGGVVTLETGQLAKLGTEHFRVYTQRGEIRPRGTTVSVMMAPVQQVVEMPAQVQVAAALPNAQSAPQQNAAAAAQSLPSVTTGQTSVSGSGPGAAVGAQMASSSVSDPLLILLRNMVLKINSNANLNVASATPAPMSSPGLQSLLDRVSARNPAEYDINLTVPANFQMNAGQLLTQMREWHAALVSHPVYGPELIGLPFPDLTDTAVPESLTTLVQSWFLRLEQGSSLGRGFDAINTTSVFPDSGVAIAVPTTVAVVQAEARQVPTEARQVETSSSQRAPVDTLPRRQSDDSRTSVINTPTQAAGLNASLAPEIVSLLSSMEGVMERLIPSPFGLPATRRITLPSFPPGVLLNDALKIFQEWRQTLLSDQTYGPQLQGLPELTLQDLQDPLRTVSLVREWYATIGNTSLGDNFSTIDTSSVFVDGRLPTPVSGIPGTVADGGASITNNQTGARVVNALSSLNIDQRYSQLFLVLALQVEGSTRIRASETGSAGLFVTMERPQPGSTLDVGEARALLSSWHASLVANPNYRQYAMENLRVPTIADVADPVRFQEIMRSWFVALDRHPDLGKLLSSTGYGWLFADEVVTVSSGAVDVITTSGSTAVNEGESVRVGVSGNTQFVSTSVLASNVGAVLSSTKLDASLFDEKVAVKDLDPGLYVWVRDGAVQVANDDKSVDVPAGNAAVATKDKLTLLDVVPNFLRFDQTPRPVPSGGSTVIDTFRAGDGAIINMCVIR